MLVPNRQLLADLDFGLVGLLPVARADRALLLEVLVPRPVFELMVYGHRSERRGEQLTSA